VISRILLEAVTILSDEPSSFNRKTLQHEVDVASVRLEGVVVVKGTLDFAFGLVGSAAIDQWIHPLFNLSKFCRFNNESHGTVVNSIAISFIACGRRNIHHGTRQRNVAGRINLPNSSIARVIVTCSFITFEKQRPEV
jgi:hypothetical protein